VKKFLKDGTVPSHSDAYARKVQRVAKDAQVVNDIVYYHLKRDNMRTKNTVLLPESLWHLVTEAAHNSWHGGHGGEDRTKERIFLSYYFPGVHNYVAQYIKKCPVCQAAKGKAPPPSPLKSLPICEGRNERVHIDLFGPLKTSASTGNKYVCVMTDAFSKQTELAAIPDKQADTVAKTFFEKWVCRYSVPLVVISDRGKEFDNQLFDKLFVELLGSDHQKTSPYHPASNSSAESFNRSMKKYLRAMLENSETLEWEAQLPMLQLSYNCHVHRSTLESPFWLTYHYDPRLPFFDMDVKRPIYNPDYASSAFQTFSEAHKLVHKNQWDARKVREEYYNRKTKERDFSVGDKVLFYVNAVPRNANEKFFKHWQGPYFVTKKISPLNYIIQQTPRSKEILCHVEKLRHLKEADYKSLFDSKKQIEHAESLKFENFKDFQEDDGEKCENKAGEFADSSSAMKKLAEPDKCDPPSPVMDPENVRVTRSRVKAGKACLVRGM
jgi:hypothetical protein